MTAPWGQVSGPTRFSSSNHKPRALIDIHHITQLLDRYPYSKSLSHRCPLHCFSHSTAYWPHPTLVALTSILYLRNHLNMLQYTPHMPVVFPAIITTAIFVPHVPSYVGNTFTSRPLQCHLAYLYFYAPELFCSATRHSVVTCRTFKSSMTVTGFFKAHRACTTYVWINSSNFRCNF